MLVAATISIMEHCIFTTKTQQLRRLIGVKFDFGVGLKFYWNWIVVNFFAQIVMQKNINYPVELRKLCVNSQGLVKLVTLGRQPRGFSVLSEA